MSPTAGALTSSTEPALSWLTIFTIVIFISALVVSLLYVSKFGSLASEYTTTNAVQSSKFWLGLLVLFIVLLQCNNWMLREQQQSNNNVSWMFCIFVFLLAWGWYELFKEHHNTFIIPFILAVVILGVANHWFGSSSPSPKKADSSSSSSSPMVNMLINMLVIGGMLLLVAGLIVLVMPVFVYSDNENNNVATFFKSHSVTNLIIMSVPVLLLLIYAYYVQSNHSHVATASDMMHIANMPGTSSSSSYYYKNGLAKMSSENMYILLMLLFILYAKIIQVSNPGNVAIQYGGPLNFLLVGIFMVLLCCCIDPQFVSLFSNASSSTKGSSSSSSSFGSSSSVVLYTGVATMLSLGFMYMVLKHFNGSASTNSGFRKLLTTIMMLSLFLGVLYKFITRHFKPSSSVFGSESQTAYDNSLFDLTQNSTALSGSLLSQQQPKEKETTMTTWLLFLPRLVLSIAYLAFTVALYVPCLVVNAAMNVFYFMGITAMFQQFYATVINGKSTQFEYVSLLVSVILLGVLLIWHFGWFTRGWYRLFGNPYSQGGKVVIASPMSVQHETTTLSTYQQLNQDHANIKSCNSGNNADANGDEEVVADKLAPLPNLNANYAVSFWLYMNATPLSANTAYNQLSTIIQYGQSWAVKYAATTNTLYITTTPNSSTAAVAVSPSPPQTIGLAAAVNKQHMDEMQEYQRMAFKMGDNVDNNDGDNDGNNDNNNNDEDKDKSNSVNVALESTYGKTLRTDSDGDRIVATISGLKLQRWNFIVINMSGGTMDVFLNADLVQSNINVTPLLHYDALMCGPRASNNNNNNNNNKGIDAGITAMLYFPHALTTTTIVDNLYQHNQHNNPPRIL